MAQVAVLAGNLQVEERSDFQPYVSNLIRIVETTIASVAVASVMLTQ